ncbi:MAG: rhomboid family intramembrane serine protease [Bacilli bacterium]
MKDTLTEKGIKDVISKELNEHYKVQNEKFQNTFKLKTSIFAFLFSLISFLVFQLLPNINIDQLVISKNNINIFKIISSIFYHNNIFVLLILVITLIYLSEIIESVYKRYKVTLIIFISIIISSLMTMTLTPNIPFYSLTPIVCSFISAYIFFGMHYKIYFVNTLKMFLLPSIIAIITIVLLDNNLFILAIGGLLGGFLGAMIGDINYEEKIKNRLNGIFLTILLVGFLLFLLYIY